MSEEELISGDADRFSYRPMHDYRRIDPDAWADQWFAGFADMEPSNEGWRSIESMLYGTLYLHPHQRESDARDLSFGVEMLQMIGQQNPYDAQAADTREQMLYTYWEQKHQLARLVARQIVRTILEDAENYAALRSEQEKSGRDSLTGVYNRRGANRQLRSLYHISNEPVRRDPSGQPLPPIWLSYFYGDINNLKWINDTLGHHIGDCVIIEVTGRINELSRESDAPIVYRQGGDEFGVILANATEAEIDAIISRIMTLQIERIAGQEYRDTMQAITDRQQQAEQSGRRLRIEAKRDRSDSVAPDGSIRIRYILYINGEPIAPLYNIVTSSVGVRSGMVNNRSDVEQLRRSAEVAMLEAKQRFPKEVRGDR